MWSGWWLFSMPWLLSATFIIQLSIVQDQEVCFHLQAGVVALQKGAVSLGKNVNCYHKLQIPLLWIIIIIIIPQINTKEQVEKAEEGTKGTDSAVMNNNFV